MGKLFLGALTALSLAAPFIQTNYANADVRPYVRCPKFLVDMKTGTFSSLGSRVGHTTYRCSDSAAQLRKQGFKAEAAREQVVQDSFLDAPRVITGRGQGYYEKAFRVTAPSREIFAEVFDCETNEGTLGIDIRRRSDSQRWYLTPSKAEPVTASFSTSSEYSITIGGVRSAVCSYRITIR